MDTLTPTSADEHAHEPGSERLWGESWYFDWASVDGALGGYVRLGLYPNLGTAWYWACVVGEDRPLSIVIDHDVALPRAGSLEIRAEGLWADHTIETPFDHVSLGCEAFAVGVDDPAEVYRGDLRGDRVPFGLDLEWETVGPGPYPYPGTSRYEIPCRVHGEVLLGEEELEIDAIGQRDHSWGVRDWWAFGWTWCSGGLDDGTRFHTTKVDGVEGYAPGYLLAQDGEMEPIDANDTGAVLGAEGLPREATVTCGPLHLTVEPVAFAPVLLVDDGPDGHRIGRFPRALCRFSTLDDRHGVGWTEWNQPQ